MCQKVQSQPKEFHLLTSNIFDWHRSDLIRVSGEIDMQKEVTSIVYLYCMLA